MVDPDVQVSAWTDSNTHDPGVTLLEVLAYTIADLASDIRGRLRAGRCGWRCALVIAVSAAGAAALINSRLSGLRRQQ